MLPITTSLLRCLPATGGGAGLAAVYTEWWADERSGRGFSDLTPSCLTSAGNLESSVRRVNSIYKMPTMDFCPLPDTAVL